MDEVVAGVLAGDRRSLARALSAVEDDPDSALASLLAAEGGKAHVVGVTGATGTGKSTLVSAMVACFRERGMRVGVLAVDPTSHISGGAVLGDRIRMSQHADDDGVFVRSMAHRGGTGGLARSIHGAVCVLDAAGFEVVIVETLGAGQDEVAIAREAHTVVVVTSPGMGDAVQVLKGGILEIGDVYVVNKTDLHGADRVVAQLSFLSETGSTTAPGGWSPPVLRTVATTGEGVDAVVDAVTMHGATEGARRERRPACAAREPTYGSHEPGVTVPQEAKVLTESRPLYGKIALASGSANVMLADEIATHLGCPLRDRDIERFANSNTFIRLRHSVRGCDVFWVQPTAAPTNDNLMELLIAIDTLRRDSAARITAIVPYFGYGRTDKKDQPRVPITARLVADMLTVAGASRVLTMDLHAGQIQGFFQIPVDDITAMHLLAKYARAYLSNSAAVLAPDIGSTKNARNFAQEVDLPLAVVEKRRGPDGGPPKVFNLIGDVDGCDVVIVDDEIDTGGTLANAAVFAKRRGARRVLAVATHGIFSEPARELLREAPIDQIAVTNTVAVPAERMPDGVEVLSVGPLLAEVIRRIHLGRSVGELFDE